MPDAVCYPIEPHDFNLMGKQLKRWSHGFVQNVMQHWRGILPIPYLSFTVGVALWDATVASLAYLILLPALSLLTANPLFLLGYFIDVPAVVFPVLMKSAERKETLKALASLPSFFVLRTVNGFFMLEALWSEIVRRKPLLVYEKGH
jgi:biofilm PGA synthesis N-glycosyltransferase PgaC